MLIVQSVTRIKYKGEFHPAYTPFEADEADRDKLKKLGCHIIKDQRAPRKISALDKPKGKQAE